MHVNVLDIDFNKTKTIGSLGETKVIAYWIRFCNETLNGEAFIIPYGNDVKRLENKTISVETSQNAIQNLKKVYDESIFKPLIKRLEDNRYIIVGKVNFVLHEVNADEDSAVVLVDVDVSGITFTIEQCEEDISKLNIGDWIEFKLEGLLLFDDGC